MRTRFRLSVLVPLFVFSILLGGSGSPAIAGASCQLSIVEWPYYDDPNLWEGFAKDSKDCTDVEMRWQIFEKDSVILNEVKSASPGTYDVVHPYTSWMQMYVDKGLVEVIDTGRLKNWNKVPEALKVIGRCGTSEHELRCPAALNGKQLFVPFDIGLSSILYRTDKVEKVHSWSWLIDDRYKGKISMFKDGPSAVAVSTYIHPDKYNEKNITPEQLDEIKQEWIRQKPLNLKYWDHELDLINDMIEDRVWMAYAWPSAYDAVRAGLKEKVQAGKIEKDADVSYADPIEKRASWVGVYGIVKGTNSPDLALQFIDNKLSDSTSMYLVNNFHYAVSNKEVMRTTTDATVKELFPDDVEIATVLFQQTNFTPELSYEQHDEWPKMWDRVLAH